MATVIAHAALPWLAARGRVPAGLSARRLGAALVLCACVADVDLLAFAFDSRPPALLANRGFTHSFFFAALFSLLCAAAFFPALVKTPRALLRPWAWLFAAGLSHLLLDLLTRAEFGLALWAPFSAARFQGPFQPVPVVLGADEALGPWGLLVVLNEALLLVAPGLWLVRALGLRRVEGRRLLARRLAAAAVGWGAVLGGLKLTFPEHVAPSRERVLLSFGPPKSEEDPQWIPRDGLPGERLVTRLDELKALGLLDVDLAPTTTPWSSSFFPSWFGGASGRWQDGAITLIGRTLRGRVQPLSREEASRLLASADPLLLRLSPTEKYDLAVGDLDFGSTRLSLAASHNASPLPRFWWGICNGIASASLVHPEPRRSVDVINPQGRVIRFLPNDVKALVGASFSWVSNPSELGGICKTVSFDSGKTCSVNPGGLVLATANRLGLARQSFLVEVHPTIQAQNYAVAKARIALLKGPYPYDGQPTSERLKGKVKALADVRVSYEVSSTTLGYASSNRALAGDPTRYQPAGLRPVHFAWEATLALDEDTTIIGGKWTGDPPDGPDTLAFSQGGPLLTDAGVLEVNPKIRWQVVEAIGRASLDEQSAAPSVDVSALLAPPNEPPDAG